MGFRTKGCGSFRATFRANWLLMECPRREGRTMMGWSEQREINQREKSHKCSQKIKKKKKKTPTKKKLQKKKHKKKKTKIAVPTYTVYIQNKQQTNNTTEKRNLIWTSRCTC